VTVAPATPTRKRPSRGSGRGSGDGWRVIALNDNHNTFDGVAFALASVLPGVTFDRGIELANRIHSSGRAIVWSGHREAAELYWSRLDGFGLTMAPFGN
jgi:ATP-dependent Clp protease adaptor protein ClpS